MMAKSPSLNTFSMQSQVSENKLLIAAAGSGKTTHIIETALAAEQRRILITTYTQANEAEIKKNIVKRNGFIPESITVQTWFSVLLQHGVRPFQGALYAPPIKGMVLVNQRSAQYIPESNVRGHYFSNEGYIFSDKISKFILKCNELTNGAVISRLEEIFSLVFIDEVQDLASYDLDLLALLFRSKISVVMVGDPRQVTYRTHHARRLEKYSGGRLSEFVLQECEDVAVTIDDTTLARSHRNNQAICDLSSKLYPGLPASQPCACDTCRNQVEHEGIFLVREADILSYMETYSPVQLRLRSDVKGILIDYPVMNFGASKGQSYDRVLIFTTEGMRDWLFDQSKELAERTKAQFYVALTRARYSVGLVCDFDDSVELHGVQKYMPETRAESF